MLLPEEGARMPGRGEAPDSTADSVSQSVWVWAGVGWAGLRIRGAGVEGAVFGP